MTRTQLEELNRAREVLEGIIRRLERKVNENIGELSPMEFIDTLANIGDARYALLVLNRIDGKEVEA